MDKLIGAFVAYLSLERHRSVHTVTGYESDLRLFCSYVHSLDETITWADVDGDLIRSWMESLMDGGCCASSVNRRLSSLRTFFRYAKERGLVAKDPAYHIVGPKKRKPLPQYVQEGDMDRLLDMPMWDDSFRDCRARTIILTFYTTGIRVSELVGLDDSSVDLSQRVLRVVGKRNKERMIPFGEELATTLRDYLSRRDAEIACCTPALFVSDKGQRMSDAQVRRLVRANLGKVTQMSKRSPHVLRHTFATAMLNHDADLESIKQLLGHESISTTEIYTHTTFSQLQRVYHQAHPRGDGDNDDETKS